MSQAPYQPLDASRSEIRLLEILSPDDTGLIICRLRTVSLLESPPFAALSYVWGDPSITEDIELDGITIAVTINLASALRHVHRQWAEVWREAWPSKTAELLSYGPMQYASTRRISTNAVPKFNLWGQYTHKLKLFSPG